MTWRIAVLGLLVACGGNAIDVVDTSDTEQGLELSAQSLHRSPLRHVQLETGIRMAYLEQGRRDGIPVILLHGYTDSHHSFDRNLPLLPERFHVFAIDQRGHGDSSKPDCCYTQADFAADVPAFMDAVGLDRASIVGHSMGSFIAQSVALEFPERLARLVLMGTAPTIAGNPVALDLKAAVDTLTDPVDAEFARAFQASTFFRPIPESFLDQAVEDSLQVPASIWQQALDGLIAEDHSDQLGEIRARTLILFGDQDVFVSAAEQAVLDAQIPRSRVITYEQTGHGLHVELPRRVSADIVDFLR